MSRSGTVTTLGGPRYVPFRCTFCPEKAAGWLDGQPVCLDCADRLIDRIEAVSLNPKMAELLPPLHER